MTPREKFIYTLKEKLLPILIIIALAAICLIAMKIPQQNP